MFKNKVCCCLAFSKQKAAPVVLEVSGCNPSVTFDNKSAVKRRLSTYCNRNPFKLPLSRQSHLRLKERSSKYVKRSIAAWQVKQLLTEQIKLGINDLDDWWLILFVFTTLYRINWWYQQDILIIQQRKTCINKNWHNSCLFTSRFDAFITYYIYNYIIFCFLLFFLSGMTKMRPIVPCPSRAVSSNR